MYCSSIKRCHWQQNKGDIHGAEEYLFQATLADPKDGEICSLYAKLVWELHRNQYIALNYFKQATQSSPENRWVLSVIYLGMLLKEVQIMLCTWKELKHPFNGYIQLNSLAMDLKEQSHSGGSWNWWPCLGEVIWEGWVDPQFAKHVCKGKKKIERDTKDLTSSVVVLGSVLHNTHFFWLRLVLGSVFLRIESSFIEKIKLLKNKSLLGNNQQFSIGKWWFLT